MENLMDGNREIDLGLVGKVEKVNPEILKILEDKGFLPVVAPIGEGPQGEIYNINADDVAGEIAVALQADKLVLLTDVPGILAENDSLISTLAVKEAEELIDRGVITSGMIPKVRSCLRALEGKVNKAHILDGRIEHVLLLEIFTQGGVGTQIINSHQSL
jgi:acetylglutamate kinase